MCPKPSRALTTYIDSTFGIDNNLADTWSQATIDAGTVPLGVDGSLTVLQLTQNSNAYIATGANINQDTNRSAASGQQNVNVVATGINSSVDLGGSVQTPGLQGTVNNQQHFILDPNQLKQNPIGGSKGTNAIGAGVLVVQYTDNVTATINSGVRIYADSLNLDAETSVTDVSATISGEPASNSAFNGVFSVVTVNDQTLAQLAKGAIITVGSGPISETNSNSVDVQANDTTHIVNVAGGILTAQNLGYGTAVRSGSGDSGHRGLHWRPQHHLGSAGHRQDAHLRRGDQRQRREPRLGAGDISGRHLTADTKIHDRRRHPADRAGDIVQVDAGATGNGIVGDEPV